MATTSTTINLSNTPPASSSSSNMIIGLQCCHSSDSYDSDAAVTTPISIPTSTSTQVQSSSRGRIRTRESSSLSGLVCRGDAKIESTRTASTAPLFSSSNSSDDDDQVGEDLRDDVSAVSDISMELELSLSLSSDSSDEKIESSQHEEDDDEREPMNHIQEMLEIERERIIQIQEQQAEEQLQPQVKEQVQEHVQEQEQRQTTFDMSRRPRSSRRMRAGGSSSSKSFSRASSSSALSSAPVLSASASASASASSKKMTMTWPRRGCMIIRTLEESLDPEKCIERMALARERRLERERQQQEYMNMYYSREEPRSSCEGQGQGENENQSPHEDRRSRSRLHPRSSKTSSSKSTPSQHRHRQHPQTHLLPHVIFTMVDIQLYPIILGYNPAVTRGPPITIDWQPFARCSVPLHTYESTRAQQIQSASRSSRQGRHGRRTTTELKISAMNRWDLMQRSGEEYAVVKKRTKEIKWIQDARMETVMKSQSKWDTDLEERMEVIRKHFKNFIFGSPKLELKFAGSTCNSDDDVFVVNDKKKSKEKEKEKKKQKKLSFKRKSKSY
eukprot:CAMPEP_0194107734 /NCGR_PEP_ID=MMETSP0150-20130528/7534_1 /TAXON_ID=122233 /ORGANISM="Chaetoceros debilis, Strain MM31A-1" /LENGTH=557 /DNA_ID=CAMNT_0038796219 /DNA_START=134 /DNA_END=1804 /DNA_ORIENTATION=+